METKAYTSVCQPMLREERKPRLAAMRSHTTYPPTDPRKPESLLRAKAVPGSQKEAGLRQSGIEVPQAGTLCIR